MPDGNHILSLDPAVRRDAFLTAADLSGKTAQVLEKDVWVVWALSVLFNGPHKDALAFKGGTSLSKAYGLIDRFSEDVDLTYDIRKLVDLPADQTEIIPRNNSQAKKLIDRVRGELPGIVEGKILPDLVRASRGLPVKPRFEAKGNNVNVYLEYEPATRRVSYLDPRVMLEFGARSTGEPTELKEVSCDAAPYLAAVSFPSATPRVMKAVRTFWEKATLIHAFCRVGGKGDKNSRHWYDLVRVYQRHPNFCDERMVAQQVVEHKSRFFPMGGLRYEDAVCGQIKLVPSGNRADELRYDFEMMREGDLLFDAEVSFDEILEACSEIESCINQNMGRQQLSPVGETSA